MRPVLPRVQRKFTIPLSDHSLVALCVINCWLRRLTVIDRIRSRPSRLAFKVSSVGAWGAIAGTVKLLLPPQAEPGDLPGY